MPNLLLEHPKYILAGGEFYILFEPSMYICRQMENCFFSKLSWTSLVCGGKEWEINYPDLSDIFTSRSQQSRTKNPKKDNVEYKKLTKNVFYIMGLGTSSYSPCNVI